MNAEGSLGKIVDFVLIVIGRKLSGNQKAEPDPEEEHHSRDLHQLLQLFPRQAAAEQQENQLLLGHMLFLAEPADQISEFFVVYLSHSFFLLP